MSNSLSDLIEILNVVLDKTIQKITIPDGVESMVIRPNDVDVHLGCDLADFVNVSGTIYLGPTSPKVGILSALSEPFELSSNEDLGNREFYLSSLEDGTCTIIYEKKLS